MLYTGSYDKTVCIWDLKSNMREPIQILSDFRDSVTSVTTTRNCIIASSVDGTIRTFDLRMGQLHTDSVGLPITHLQLSQDQKCLSASCLGGDLYLMDISTGTALQSYGGRVHDSFKLESAFCPDATHVCAASEDGTVRFWQQVTGAAVPVYMSASAKESSLQCSTVGAKIHNRSVYSVATHPSMNVFVASCSDGHTACFSYSSAAS